MAGRMDLRVWPEVPSAGRTRRERNLGDPTPARTGRCVLPSAAQWKHCGHGRRSRPTARRGRWHRPDPAGQAGAVMTLHAGPSAWRSPVSNLGRLLGFLVTAWAVVRELRTPRDLRTWHGRVAGFIPYDFPPSHGHTAARAAVEPACPQTGCALGLRRGVDPQRGTPDRRAAPVLPSGVLS